MHTVQPGVDDHINTAASRAWNDNASWAVFVTQPSDASVLSRWALPQLSYLVNVWKAVKHIAAQMCHKVSRFSATMTPAAIRLGPPGRQVFVVRALLPPSSKTHNQCRL